MRHKELRIAGVIIGLLGFIVLVWQAPWIALGVFLAMFGDALNRTNR